VGRTGEKIRLATSSTSNVNANMLKAQQMCLWINSCFCPHDSRSGIPIFTSAINVSTHNLSSSSWTRHCPRFNPPTSHVPHLGEYKRDPAAIPHAAQRHCSPPQINCQGRPRRIHRHHADVSVHAYRWPLSVQAIGSVSIGWVWIWVRRLKIINRRGYRWSTLDTRSCFRFSSSSGFRSALQ